MKKISPLARTKEVQSFHFKNMVVKKRLKYLKQNKLCEKISNENGKTSGWKANVR